MMAKFIDGVFTPAPNKISRVIDGVEYNTYNPTEEILIEEGWVQVTETEPGEAPEGYHFEPYYEEQNGDIVQLWEQVEDTDIPDNESLDIILGGYAVD